MNNKINKAYHEGKIIMFDTTLRDGDQASGFHMLRPEKIAIAKQLARLNVDVIEAGFAGSSAGDFESVYSIAKEVGSENGPVICSLSRAVPADIEAAARAIAPAKNQRIHTFIATSDIHMDKKFRKSKEWVVDSAVKAVQKARSYVNDVEFSCEDFGRSDLDYIVDVTSAVIDAGAETVNLPDTVGWLQPHESYERIKYVIEKVRAKGLNAIFSVHNHNDLGMATANTVEGIRAGARQVEVTINGIGERAGNTALEEVVAAMKTRNIGKCNIETKLIGETSRLLSKFTGVVPQPNKAVVGRNAFAHEAGIHQDGMIKGASTYEIMNPIDYGVVSSLTFGPRSGRRALTAKYESLGITFEEGEFDKVALQFKEIADTKRDVDDADLILAKIGEKNIPEAYKIVAFESEEGLGPYFVKLVLSYNGKMKGVAGRGNGRVDAALNGIREMLPYQVDIKDFKTFSNGPGSNALAETEILLVRNGWEAIGRASNTDIYTSAVHALIDGCNRIDYINRFFKK